MHLNRRILLMIPGLLSIPQLSQAAAATSSNTLGDYNITLISLVGLILVLLFIIGMLAHTMSQLAIVVKDKARMERSGSGNATKVMTILAFLLLSAGHAFAEGKEEAATVFATAPVSISGIPTTQFYIILGIIALELLVIFALVFYTRILLNIVQGKPELEAKAKAIVQQKSWFWDKLNSAASTDKEEAILLDHDYDGIRELDNSLPPWWKYGFYLTIVVSFIYIYRFHISHDGQSQLEELATEIREGEEAKAAYLAKAANNVDENSVTLLTSAGEIASGKEVFVKNCAACHLADGGGSVGPNLTDDHWLHGGSVKDIFKSIKYGWQDKGMKSWKDDLSPIQIQQLASFIKSLKGTHPATPKAPQGDIYIEASGPKTDSAAAGKVAGK